MEEKKWSRITQKLIIQIQINENTLSHRKPKENIPKVDRPSTEWRETNPFVAGDFLKKNYPSGL